MISERLKAASVFLKDHVFLADCGTDHGYLPIYAIEQGYVRKAIASDNKAKPLANAKANVEAAGLTDRIEMILAEGLSYLAGRNDVVSVMGMGGRLIVDILKQADLSGVKRLVLSPNSEASELRDYLLKTSWRIIDEDFLKEKGKYYQIVCAEPGSMKLTEMEKEYGPVNMQKRNNAFLDYLNKQIRILEEALANVKGSERKEELTNRISSIKEVLK